MKLVTGALALLGISVAGCGATHSVAVTSYNAVTAPVRLVHRAIAGKPANTTSNRSDVTSPGQPIAAATPAPTPHVQVHKAGSGTSTKTAQTSRPKSTPKQKTSSTTYAASYSPQFPVAKSVPGKPGLVYNPFNQDGALIDVSGYPPGSKVKDPDSQKIFIVP